MTTLARTLVLSLALLLVFLVLALSSQWWLGRETQRLKAEAVTGQRAQFEAALRLLRRPPAQWDAALARELGAMLGSSVVFYEAGAAAPELAEAGLLHYDYQPPGPTTRRARVYFPLAGALRLATLHNRLLLANTLLALVLLLVPVIIFLFRNPDSGSSVARPPWATAKAEMSGLQHFARISHERGTELAREFDARQRAEEDLQVSRTQLERSLEDRVQLGRDLHDNMSQTLYGLSLTLESAAKRLGSDAPPETRQRLELAVTELRRLNQEVRTYIRELEPAKVQLRPFVESLSALLDALATDRAIQVERRIDPEALAQIAPERSADVLNILREAVSNSLRHAGGRTLTLHAQRGEGSVIFAVQDDGAGFDQAGGASPGHGLVNMQARARALGGELRVVSAPGKGTRVLLTLPVASGG